MFKVGDIVRFKHCILNSSIMTLCDDYFDYLKGD